MIARADEHDSWAAVFRGYLRALLGAAPLYALFVVVIPRLAPVLAPHFPVNAKPGHLMVAALVLQVIAFSTTIGMIVFGHHTRFKGAVRRLLRGWSAIASISICVVCGWVLPTSTEARAWISFSGRIVLDALVFINIVYWPKYVYTVWRGRTERSVVLIPPGIVCRDHLARVFGTRICSAVFEPVIADMQYEWREAMIHNRAREARSAAIRGYLRVLLHLVAYVANTVRDVISGRR